MIEGSHTGGRAIVCGVMHREFQRIDSILGGGARGIVMTVAEDPSTVFGFCCGDDPPVSELPIGSVRQEEQRYLEAGISRAHYTNCELWQREKVRIEVGADAIFPRPTSSKPLQIGEDGVVVDPLDPHLQQHTEAAVNPIDWQMD